MFRSIPFSDLFVACSKSALFLSHCVCVCVLINDHTRSIEQMIDFYEADATLRSDIIASEKNVANNFSSNVTLLMVYSAQN